ncbi:hypothetical protein G9A89_001680 [Geosiphon pyriformis]|nr:hypothetical protein G9A89_001680 [Geosiphon pyriformis]
MRQLESQQQNQFKELIAEFANIFAKNNNDLRRTDLEMPNQDDSKPTELLQKVTNLSAKKYNGCSTMDLFNYQ